MKTILLILALTTGAMASTMGVSTHPLGSKKHLVTTEFNSYLSNGSGIGITARYLQKMNHKMNFDAGVTVADGERSNRIFGGFDYELYPDYAKQPRISIKGLLETASIYGDRINSFGFAPSVAKGFMMWGQETYPYVSLPVKVGLNSSESTYTSSFALATGITSSFRIDQKEVIASVEANVNLKDSYTGLVFGVTLPL